MNCSVDRKSIFGSCFKEEEINQIIIEYNKKFKTNYQISLPFDKKYELLKRLFNCKIDQCILDNSGLRFDILKPIFPGHEEWLSNIDIDSVMKQYERKYVDFEFIGTFPIDFQSVSEKMKNFNISNAKNKIGIIFNTDYSYSGGDHWISLFIDKIENTICFFDSYGNPPPRQINNLIKSLPQTMKLFINQNQHQYENSACGLYSLYFITEKLNGKSCSELNSNIINDDMMNNIGKDFFREEA